MALCALHLTSILQLTLQSFCTPCTSLAHAPHSRSAHTGCCPLHAAPPPLHHSGWPIQRAHLAEAHHSHLGSRLLVIGRSPAKEEKNTKCVHARAFCSLEEGGDMPWAYHIRCVQLGSTAVASHSFPAQKWVMVNVHSGSD